MNAVDEYVQAVMRNIHAPENERQRIEADLRGHFQEALEAGEPAEAVLARMGAPAEVAVSFMEEVTLAYAGFWPRLAAFAIDMGLLILVLFASIAVSVAFTNLVPEHPQGLGYVVGAVLIAGIFASVLAAVGLLLLYFPLLEGRFGQTLGKRLLGLRVLREDGLPVGYREAFLRRISYYFEVIVIDALFIPFSPKRQRAFDTIAKTIVIHERGKKTGA